MAWLTTRPDAAPSLTTPQDVLQALPAFRDEVAALNTRWHGHLTWTKLLETAMSVGRKAGLIVQPPSGPGDPGRGTGQESPQA